MGLLIAVTFQSGRNSPFEYCQEGVRRYTDQVPSEPHLAGALTLTVELDLSHPPESSRAAWGHRAARLSGSLLWVSEDQGPGGIRALVRQRAPTRHVSSLLSLSQDLNLSEGQLCTCCDVAPPLPSDSVPTRLCWWRVAPWARWGVGAEV